MEDTNYIEYVHGGPRNEIKQPHCSYCCQVLKPFFRNFNCQIPYEFPKNVIIMSVKIEVDVLNGEDALRQQFRACRGCLETAGKLYDLREKRMDEVFLQLTGLPMATCNMPMLVCPLCLQQLRKFGRFRIRCHSASYSLQQIYYQNQTTNSIDSKHLKYNLIKTETEVMSFVPSTPRATRPKRKTRSKVNETDSVEVELQRPEEVFVDIKDDTIKKEESNYKTEHSIGSKGEPLMDTVINYDSDKSDDDYKPSDLDSSGIDDDDDNLTLKEVMKEKKANVKSKSNKSKKGVLKERTEDKKLIKEISDVFKKMWRWKTEEKMDIFRMFEKIHEESLAVNNGETGNCKCDPKHKKGMVCVKQELRIFLNLVKKLSDLYNVDVDFLSVERQKQEIEDRRKTVEFQEAQYKCELCCKIFKFPDTYKRHTASHDVHPGDMECEICRYRFKRHASLMTHIHTMHSKKLKCKECGFVNRTWNLAKEHYDYHQGIASVCHLCGKNFNKKKHYLMHLRKVHKAQVATTLCLLCGDSFNGPTGLRIHMDRSHRQAVKCPSCGGWFLNGDMLETHLNNSSGGCKPGHSACPMCGANFSSEELMWQHHDEQHIQEYKCEQCNKTYAGLRKYKWHIENKHTKGRIRAELAGKLRRRPQNKPKGNNFVCDVCGKDDFPFLSSLRFHMRKHSDEKPFQCTVCDKAFKAKLNLKVHMTTHTDERRYQCPYCPKAFKQYQHRTVHIRTHTKERPYACNTCTKRYTGLTALKEHINTAHRGLPPRQRAKDKQEM